MKRTFCLLVVLAGCFLSIQNLAAKETKLQRKLRTIVIDHIEVEDVSVEALVKLLRIRAKDLDPRREGINIVLLLDPPKKRAAAQKKAIKKDAEDDEEDFLEEVADEATGKNQQTLTLIFSDISLGAALKQICRAANLVYKVERHAVVIAHKDFPISKMETRIYPVEPEGYQIIKERLGK